MAIVYDQRNALYSFGNVSDSVTFSQTVIDPVTKNTVSVVGFGESGTNAHNFCILLENAKPLDKSELPKS